MISLRLYPDVFHFPAHWRTHVRGAFERAVSFSETELRAVRGRRVLWGVGGGEGVEDLFLPEGSFAERGEGEQRHDEGDAAEDEVVDAEGREEGDGDEQGAREEVVFEVRSAERRLEECGEGEFGLDAFEVGEGVVLFQPAVDGAHFDVCDAHILKALHDAVGAPVHTARDDEDAAFPEFGGFCRYGVHIAEPEGVEFDGGKDGGVAGEEIVFAELDVVPCADGAEETDEIFGRADGAFESKAVAGAGAVFDAEYVDGGDEGHECRGGRYGKHRRPGREHGGRPYKGEQKGDDGERRHVYDARHGEMMSAFARVYAKRRRNARFVRKISAEMRASS